MIEDDTTSAPEADEPAPGGEGEDTVTAPAEVETAEAKTAEGE